MNANTQQGERLDLVIVGAGGFARELQTWLPEVFAPDRFRFKGFLGREADNTSEDCLTDPRDYDPQPNDRFLLAIGDLPARREVTSGLLAKGARFVDFIHPTSIIAPTATIGIGAVIYPYAIISNAAQIGDFVHVSLHASVGHDARIGDNCYLSPYATLNGESRIGDDVFLGSHTTVGPGVCIGNDVRISANSAALRNVPDGSFVHGVPGVCTSRINTTGSKDDIS